MLHPAKPDAASEFQFAGVRPGKLKFSFLAFLVLRKDILWGSAPLPRGLLKKAGENFTRSASELGVREFILGFVFPLDGCERSASELTLCGSI